MKSRRISLVLGFALGACSSPSTEGRGGGGGAAGGGGAGIDGASGSGGEAGRDGTDGSLDGWAGQGGQRGGLDAPKELVVVSPEGGQTCGMTTTKIPHSPKTPDVIISFDRSGSMYERFGANMNRFEAERDILMPLITMYEARIRWGYSEFPASRTCAPNVFCCVDAAVVTPMAGNAVRINERIRNAMDGAGQGTPTPLGLKRVADHFAGLADGVKERWVLLSTDGQPNCALNGQSETASCTTDPMGTVSCPYSCTQSVDQVKALAGMGVKTVVLGVSRDAFGTCLERMAQAGGAPRPGGGPAYYPAANPDELRKHLESIIGGIATPTCFVDLTTAPADPSRVAVFFDQAEVPWDPTHTNGWDYDPPGTFTRVRVYGSYCSKVETFTVSTIDVRYGCPPCTGTAAC